MSLGLLPSSAVDAVLRARENATWPEALLAAGLQPDQISTVRESLSGEERELFLDEVDVTVEADGRYYERHLLGEGGMGRVALASDAHLHRQVAVKELLVQHPAMELRFLREARITAQLEHPGIVPVYELGRRANGTLYYTMKEVRGRTLREVLADAETLSDRLRRVGVLIDLCQAVGYAHSKGVVHRDLKPDNIMIGAFGEVTVLDWGLAKVAGEPDLALPVGWTVGSGSGADLTRAGTVMGTPKYMSPEQAAGNLPSIDARSDVWSIGVILYELLTGGTPFEGPNASVLRQVQEGVWVPPSELADGLPPSLVAICMKALERAPADRYAHAAELALELESWRDGALVGAHTYSPFEHLRRAGTRFWPVAVGLLGCAIGVGATVWWKAEPLAVARAMAQQGDIDRAYLSDLVEAATDPFPAHALARLRHAATAPGITPGLRERAGPLLDAVRPLGDIRVLHTEPIRRLAWTPSRGRLAWLTSLGVHLADPESGAYLGTVRGPGVVTAYAFPLAEGTLWLGQADGLVLRIDLNDLGERARVQLEGPVEALAFDAEGLVAWTPTSAYRVTDSGSSPLQKARQAPSLRATEGAWEVEAIADTVVVRSADGIREVPVGFTITELALGPHAVAVGGEGGVVLVTLTPGDALSNLRVCPDGRVVPVLPYPTTQTREPPDRACEP